MYNGRYIQAVQCTKVAIVFLHSCTPAEGTPSLWHSGTLPCPLGQMQKLDDAAAFVYMRHSGCLSGQVYHELIHGNPQANGYPGH